MPRYFAQADLLLATLRREPIFAYTIPSKLQSYFACGRPVVAALEGDERAVLQELEARVGARVLLRSDSQLHHEQFDLLDL